MARFVWNVTDPDQSLMWVDLMGMKHYPWSYKHFLEILGKFWIQLIRIVNNV